LRRTRRCRAGEPDNDPRSLTELTLPGGHATHQASPQPVDPQHRDRFWSAPSMTSDQPGKLRDNNHADTAGTTWAGARGPGWLAGPGLKTDTTLERAPISEQNHPRTRRHDPAWDILGLLSGLSLRFVFQS